MGKVAQERWRMEWRELSAEAEFNDQVEALVTGKYARAEYNQKR